MFSEAFPKAELAHARDHRAIGDRLQLRALMAGHRQIQRDAGSGDQSQDGQTESDSEAARLIAPECLPWRVVRRCSGKEHEGWTSCSLAPPLVRTVVG